MTIEELIKESHETALSKGFWQDGNRNISEALLRIHEEISEAGTEHRKGRMQTWFSEGEQLGTKKPEGFAIELADAMIRLADLCGGLGINLEEALRLKMDYNKTRGYRHGDKI